MSNPGSGLEAIEQISASQDLSLDVPQLAPASAVGGMFKKRAKTNSAQKGLRRPTAVATTAATITISDDSSDDEDYDDQQHDRHSGILAGRKRKRGGIIQAGSARKPAAKEDLGVSYDITARSDSHLEPKNQATAVSAEFSDSELLGRAKALTPVESTTDNLYRGQKNYRTLIPKREQLTTKYNAMGPQKSASNVRMTTVTDYAPDVCKDYKLTGYCGFGDNCKFLHDRGDYKAGWQIDKDWEIEQQKKNDLVQADEDSDSDDDMDNVPFVCLICREDYEDPVVTKCGHYFCMKCAVKRYKKTPNCLVCGTGTMGIFNKARDFEKKLEAKRQRKEEKERRKQGLGDSEGGEVDTGSDIDAEVSSP